MSSFSVCQCGQDLRSEYFMVRLSIWERAVRYWKTDTSVLLCVGCIELGIGRRLLPTDIAKCPLNYMNVVDPQTSDRLRSRLVCPDQWADSYFINYLDNQ